MSRLKENLIPLTLGLSMRLRYLISIFLLNLIIPQFTLADSVEPDLKGFKEVVAPYFKNHCESCHGDKEPEAKLSLTKIDPDILKGEHFENWKFVEERLKYGEMPPGKKRQPPKQETEKVLSWIRQELRKTQLPGVITDPKLALPKYGNYVNHEELFNKAGGVVIPAAPRLWRMRPSIYQHFVNQITERVRRTSQPFSILQDADFKDYAFPYFIDEPTTDMLLRNAELIVENQLKHGRYRDMRRLVQEDTIPKQEDLEKALRAEFQLVLRRNPTKEEIERFCGLWQKNKKISGHVIAGKTMLMAVIMQPEALFRMELGKGPIDAHGRRRLSEREIGIALSYTLGNRLDRKLMEAAQQGKLKTQEQLETHVKRILKEEDNSRILQFFREYFDYPKAPEVFKDPPMRGRHEPRQLVADLEYVISDIVEKDQNVLYELLTTNKYFVNYRVDSNREKKIRKGVRFPGYETVYGLPPDWKWTAKQPIELPADKHAGVLTHPAWLVAFSTNFDTDPVRRGKWIRTHLLGGTVPDVPIGVDARIPEDEHKTLRQRLNMVSRVAECWRCHKKMNPLGVPFEQYGPYGPYRQLELGKTVETQGEITRSGDPELDGEVTNPIEMVHKLAKSKKVEQVFVRHAFRFFLGRNETLGDAKTLQDAHRAYAENNGSFNALVVSLVTSDSFLYRAAESEVIKRKTDN